MRIEPGQRVRLKNGHPWTGYTGQFVGYEKVGNFGDCPKVRLDIGIEVFVMEPRQWGPA